MASYSAIPEAQSEGAAAPSTAPRTRARTVAAAAVFCAGAALLGYASSSSSRAAPLGGDAAVPSAAAAASAAALAADVANLEIFDCGSYDDDSTYTNATCKGFDTAACNMHCTEGWCLDLCGDACESGAGAICATAYLSDITATCESISWNEGAPSTALTGDKPYGKGSGVGDAEGCDHHVYCAFCESECQNLLNQWPEGRYTAFTNVGPHAMRLLGNLTTICASVTEGPSTKASPLAPDSGPDPPPGAAAR